MLGEGGFGKVYRVHHTGWNVDLAVKTPRLDRLDEVGKENFRTEAETWVSLGLHPHIVSCYYVRDLGGIPRVFAEFVEGGSLADWIRSGKLYEGGPDETLKRILDVAIQLAWGLAYAHEQGLVHQDVKPGNVMMTPEGVAKVTDFGLAKARSFIGAESESGFDPTKSVVVPGSGAMSPAYASPEQAAGKHLSLKTDIWSWAVSVLEMFTGDVTWMSGVIAAEALEGYLENGAEDVRIPRMPEEVSDLLGNCFQESPADRPQDMMRAAELLQRSYEEVIGNTYPRQAPKAAETIADSLNNRAVSLMDLGKQAEAETLWREALELYPGHPETVYNRGLIRWRSGGYTDVDLLADIEEVKKSHPEDWRCDYFSGLVHTERMIARAQFRYWKMLKGADANRTEIQTALMDATRRLENSTKVLRTFGDAGIGIRSVCLTPDARYVFAACADGFLRLWNTETAQCLQTIAHAEYVRAVSVSQDARFAISLDHSGALKFWEVMTGQCLHTLEAIKDGYGLDQALSDNIQENCLNAACLSSDGTLVLTAGHYQLRLWKPLHLDAYISMKKQCRMRLTTGTSMQFL